MTDLLPAPPTTPTALTVPAPPAGRWALPRWLRITLLLTPAMTVVAVFFVGGVGQALAQSLGHQPGLSHSHLSGQAYRAIATDPAVRGSLALTLQVGIISTAMSAALGVGLALLLHRSGSRHRWTARLVQANLAVPHLVGALCILLLLSQTGLVSRLAHAIGLIDSAGSFPALTADRFGLGIMAEYIWKETPFITVLALTALNRGVSDLANAARTLGARRWQRLWHVTLPMLAPTVAAGSVLVFAFAAGSYEVPYLLGRPYPATLPVVAYQYYTDTDLTARPEAMAIAVLITLISVLAAAAYLALLARLTRRSL